MKTWLKVVTVIIAVLIIFVIAGVYFIYKSIGNPLDNFNNNDKQVLINRVDLFIKDIAIGKVNDALDLTDKQTITADVLNGVYQQGYLSNYISQDMNFHNIEVAEMLSGNMNVTYSTVVYFSDNIEGQMIINALKENGKWKIHSFGMTTPPEKIW